LISDASGRSGQQNDQESVADTESPSMIAIHAMTPCRPSKITEAKGIQIKGQEIVFLSQAIANIFLKERRAYDQQELK
jgi:hypothetical protein